MSNMTYFAERRRLEMDAVLKKAGAVAEFLDATAKGAIAPFRAAVQRNVDAEQIVAGEDVSQQCGCATDLASILAQPLGRQPQRGAVLGLETEASAGCRPRSRPGDVAH